MLLEGHIADRPEDLPFKPRAVVLAEEKAVIHCKDVGAFQSAIGNWQSAISLEPVTTIELGQRGRTRPMIRACG
jgi:hypothetical protein